MRDGKIVVQVQATDIANALPVHRQCISGASLVHHPVYLVYKLNIQMPICRLRVINYAPRPNAQDHSCKLPFLQSIIQDGYFTGRTKK